MIERRCGVRGRRETDAAFCEDHKVLVKSVQDVEETVKTHTNKLDKFFGRINTILVTFCLALLGVLADIVFRR